MMSWCVCHHFSNIGFVKTLIGKHKVKTFFQHWIISKWQHQTLSHCSDQAELHLVSSECYFVPQQNWFLCSLLHSRNIFMFLHLSASVLELPLFSKILEVFRRSLIKIWGCRSTGSRCQFYPTFPAGLCSALLLYQKDLMHFLSYSHPLRMSLLWRLWIFIGYKITHVYTNTYLLKIALQTDA